MNVYENPLAFDQREYYDLENRINKMMLGSKDSEQSEKKLAPISSIFKE